jgi:predicted ATP-binding protein involved in virulence
MKAQYEYEDAVNNTAPDLQSWLQTIATALMNYFGSSAASIFINRGNEYICCLGATGFVQNLSGIAIYKKGTYLTGKVFKDKKSYNFKTAEEVNAYRGFDEGKYAFFKNVKPTQNIMIAPLKVGKDVLGIVKVENKKENAFFSDLEFNDFLDKCKEITEKCKNRLQAVQKIPFYNEDGSYDIYPYGVFVMAKLKEDNFYYPAGIKRISYQEKDIIDLYLKGITNFKKEDCLYEVNLLNEDKANVSKDNLKLFAQMIQEGDVVDYRKDIKEHNYPHKGRIVKVNYTDFTLLVRNLDGSYEDVIIFANMRKYYEPTNTKLLKTAVEPSIYKHIGNQNVLTSLTIKNNFFHDLSWHFDPHMNVLVGKNGFGKSYLLKILGGLAERERQIPNIVDDKNDKSYTNTVWCELNFKSTEQDFSIRYDKNELVDFYAHKNKIPILYFPAVRYLPSDQHLSSNNQLMGNKTFYEVLAQDFIKGKPCGELTTQFFFKLANVFYRNRQDRFVKFIEDIFYKLTENKLHIDDVKPNGNIWDIWVKVEGFSENSGKVTKIQHISSGVISVWVIFGMIYDYLEQMHNQQNDNTLPIQERSGIVVIDEIETHLHETWKKKIVTLLRESFPHVQFIIVSHSPLVAAGCKQGELSRLIKAPNEDGFTIEQFFTQEFISPLITEIYLNAFDIDDVHADIFQQYLDKYKIGRLDELKAKLEDMNQKGLLQNEEGETFHDLSQEYKIILQVKKSELRSIEKLEKEIKHLRTELAKIHKKPSFIKKQPHD